MVEGWGKPFNSRKFHYFRNGRSLCGKWFFLSKDLERGKEEHPENCRTCANKLFREKKRREKQRSS